MKIKRIIIDNFKIFEHSSFDLGDFSIIVGDNGTGKSTLIEAIHLALTGYYRGKSIIGNISQDLFNKKIVDKFVDDFNNSRNPELPKVKIEVFFDDYPDLNGNNNSTGSGADGFSFNIVYDNRNDDAYKELVSKKSLNSLPFEFYKCEWTTFSRKYYTNSRNIDFKSAFLNTQNFRIIEQNSNKLIRNYVDDSSKIELNQRFREMTDSLVQSDSFSHINNKINDCDELKNRNITIGISNSSQSVWEEAITIKEDGISYENIGTGKQCLISTILSFENDVFKNKSILLIEEPENHLSGMNLNILLNYIKEHVSGFQVLISTHSSFVLNKLGMDNLLLLNDNRIINFKTLSKDTAHYFEKVSGFDTLRFILCRKAILVEGDSDDLIIQRAYFDLNGRLPIEDGIEIITTSLSFSRFLDLAKLLNIKVVVVTDNDGNIDKIKKLKNQYKDYGNIKICSGEKAYTHEELAIDKEKVKNVNTLEPEILRANERGILNSIFEKEYPLDEDLLHYMVTNKTECAWKIFNSKTCIEYPKYVNEAISDE